MPKKKPPARRKRSAPQGAESHQKKQERLEARRRAKEAALIAQRRKERRDKAIRRAAFVLFLLAVAYLIFFRQTAPSEIAGKSIASFSTSNGGDDAHVAPYNYTEGETGVSPPVSGRHDPVPAECGIHSERVPDENLVHTLEHGAVAVLYNPKEVPLPEIGRIEDIVTGYEDTVMSAPYPGLPDAIVLASWSRKMALDEFDSDAITEYIDTFRDTEPAPEFNGEDPCETVADDAYEPPEPSPSPEPSPAPSPSPEGGGGNDDPGGKGGGGSGDGKDDTGGKGGTDDSDGDKMEKEEGN